MFLVLKSTASWVEQNEDGDWEVLNQMHRPTTMGGEENDAAFCC